MRMIRSVSSTERSSGNGAGRASLAGRRALTAGPLAAALAAALVAAAEVPVPLVLGRTLRAALLTATLLTAGAALLAATLLTAGAALLPTALLATREAALLTAALL